MFTAATKRLLETSTQETGAGPQVQSQPMLPSKFVLQNKNKNQFHEGENAWCGRL